MSGSHKPKPSVPSASDATIFEASADDGATVSQDSQIGDDGTLVESSDLGDDSSATAMNVGASSGGATLPLDDESGDSSTVFEADAGSVDDRSETVVADEPEESSEATVHGEPPDSQDHTLVEDSEMMSRADSSQRDDDGTMIDEQGSIEASGATSSGNATQNTNNNDHSDRTVIDHSDRTVIEEDNATQPAARQSAVPASSFDGTVIEDTSNATGGGSQQASFGQRTMPNQGATRPSATVTSPGRSPSQSSSGSSRASSTSGVGSSGAKPPAGGKLNLGDRYQLVENFAHGGLGNIWRAEDKALRREVAFKELLPKALRNKVVVERFLEEAQITGQLEHPGIIPIYDLGFQENGAPFYAMKLLKGGNMEKAIEEMHALPRGSSERQLAFTRLMRQFVSVCQAVGFAHEKGVLHRDLKPLNIMLGEFGETLVLDWGLAKLVDIIGERMVSSDRSDTNAPDDDFMSATAQTESRTAVVRGGSSADEATVITPTASDDARSGQTEAAGQLNSTRGATAGGPTQGAPSGATQAKPSQTQQSSTVTSASQRQVTSDRSAGSQTMMGQIMGTPAYMPPEQAKGLINELDARTDIYSLGGILYKLLTNEQPIGRGKIKEVLDAVISGRIKPPREIDPTIKKPLEAICQKAMATKKADRYQTAIKLAEDVEAWLADEPVSVYPEPLYVRSWRWMKRHPTLVGTSSAVLLAMIVGSTLWSIVEGRRVEGLRLAAQGKVTEARGALDQSDFSKADSLLNEALGQVQAEHKLAAVKVTIQNQLDDVARLRAAAERERLAGVRNKAEQRLAEVQRAIDDQKDFPLAKNLLTEVVTLLSSEASLKELQWEAQTRLDAVNVTLTKRADIDTANATLAKFAEEVELTRVYGGRLSGDDSIDDSREAKRHGLAALKMFEIDFAQPKNLDPRLKLLGDEAVSQWRLGLLEALLTLARQEDALAQKDDADDVRAATRRALERVNQAEQLDATSQPLWFLKGDLHNALDETDAANAAYQKANALKPVTRFDHFTLGERARYQRKFDAALLHYQDALRVDPDDFWSLYLMGLCHLQAGRPAAAAVSYTASISRRPNFAFAYIVRGYVFAVLQQFDNAQRDFAKALELEPNSYHAILNRGAAYFLAKDYDKARADFEQAETLKPDQAGPLINLAEVAWQKGGQIAQNDPAADATIRAAAEYQNALVALTKAVLISPQQGSLYFTRGRTQLSLNDSNAALADFKRAHAFEPNPIRRALASKEIGRVHNRAQRMEMALTAYDQSLAENPNDNDVIRLRAEALLALNRDSEAITAFTSFLEKAGPVGDVYRARGLALAKQKKYREAINDYTMSLQYEPSPNMLTQRGKAYLLETAKLAKEDFEEALRLNPENPETHHFLAYAMVLLGDHVGATARIEKSTAVTKLLTTKYGPPSWPFLFNPATVYSQAVGKVLLDPKLSVERRNELAKQYAARAVELLTDASKLAGPTQQAAFVQTLRADDALDPIRQRAEFLDALKTLDPESVPAATKPKPKPSDE